MISLFFNFVSLDKATLLKSLSSKEGKMLLNCDFLEKLVVAAFKKGLVEIRDLRLSGLEIIIRRFYEQMYVNFVYFTYC